MSLPPTYRPTPLSANAARLLQQGQAGLRSGNLAAAADAGQSMLREDPRRSEGWVLLCSALIHMGSADDDRALGDALSMIDPRDPAHAMLAAERCRVLAKRGRYGEAVELARLLEAHVPLTPRQQDTLSGTYTAAGLFDDGLRQAERAVAAMPKDPSATYNLALSLRYLGRVDEAITAFEQIVRDVPNHTLAYFSLADCARWTPERNHIPAIQAAMKLRGLTVDDGARLHYALFKEAHDTGDYDLAWNALTEGARLAHSREPYNLPERTRFTDGLIATFRGNLDTPPAEGPDPIPIFIVGLPRSGTTLVERIFSAHPDVTDMGETHGFALAIRDAAGLSRFGELDAATLQKVSKTDWADVGRRYIRSLDYRRPATRFFTEKLPHNYHLVGPMRLAFPQARFVHLRRAPMDSLFGAYKMLFGEGSYLWSYRFEDLAAAYTLYRRVTDHWRSELGQSFVDLTLEHLIASPETEIRSLLKRTGLDFHPDCLSPHTAKGGVSTASATQVRQPINSQGVGAWRRYESGFEPLRRLLEERGFVDAKGDPVW